MKLSRPLTFEDLMGQATEETTPTEDEVRRALALEEKTLMPLGKRGLGMLTFTGPAEVARFERGADNAVDHQDSLWSLHGNHSD